MQDPYPPLPNEPACWSWELPPLPQPPVIERVRAWQTGRCAICGLFVPERNELVEDHDHATGDTRGFLCHRCNTSEGKRNPHPVFLRYRKQYPTLMLGVPHRKGRLQHPAVTASEEAFGEALGDLARLTDPAELEFWREHAEELRRHGLAEKLPPSPVRTPLIDALERVGLTSREWRETQDRRRAQALAEQVHLPASIDSTVQACNLTYRWRPPPRRGITRQACADCYLINPNHMRRLVGDGAGYPLPGLEACGVCSDAPPPGFTCNHCGAVDQERHNAMRDVGQ